MRNRVAWGIVAILAVVVLGEAQAARPAALPASRARNGEAIDGFGRTALMLAAFKADTVAARALLQQGSAVNTKDKNGMTALMWAAPEVVALLLKSGADVHARDNFGRTALSYAAYQEDADRIRTLQASGSPLDDRDEDGRTPLFFALYGECTYGGTGRRPFKETVFMHLVRGPRQDRCIDVVKLLLDRGANVNASDNTGRTPLVFFAWNEMLAGLRDDRQLVEYLLDKGANVNAADREGKTALMGRALWGDASMVELLLKHGADASATTHNGRTALTIANWGVKPQVRALLLEVAAARAPSKAKQP